MSTYNYLRLEKEGDLVTLTVSRPKALNALNRELVLELGRAFEGLAREEKPAAVILTGEGDKAFVAGADIGEMLDMDLERSQAWSELGHRVFTDIQNFPRPVIAAVNGYALGGGCELALACDIRIASEKAKFGFPEVGLGVIPGFGGTQRLPRLVGKSRAKLLMFSGETIGAEEALRIGLVDQVTQPENLMPACKELAAKIAAKAPLALANVKAAVERGAPLELEKALALEAALFSTCFSTRDQKEGMRAFLEKRKPVFNGE